MHSYSKHSSTLSFLSHCTDNPYYTHCWPWGQSGRCVWSADTELHPGSVWGTGWPPPPSETPSQPGSQTVLHQKPVQGSGSRLFYFQRCRAGWWCCCAGSLAGCWPPARSPRGSPPAGWTTGGASLWTWQHTRCLCSSLYICEQWQTVHCSMTSTTRIRLQYSKVINI